MTSTASTTGWTYQTIQDVYRAGQQWSTVEDIATATGIDETLVGDILYTMRETGAILGANSVTSAWTEDELNEHEGDLVADLAGVISDREYTPDQASADIAEACARKTADDPESLDGIGVDVYNILYTTFTEFAVSAEELVAMLSDLRDPSRVEDILAAAENLGIIAMTQPNGIGPFFAQTVEMSIDTHTSSDWGTYIATRVGDVITAYLALQTAPEPVKTAGTCRCGCGNAPRRPGRTYLPGHDARHAGIVGRAVAGLQEAAPDADISHLLAELPSENLQLKAMRIAATALAKAAKKATKKAAKS